VYISWTIKCSVLVYFIIFIYLIAFVGSIIVYIRKMQRWRIT